MKLRILLLLLFVSFFYLSCEKNTTDFPPDKTADLNDFTQKVRAQDSVLDLQKVLAIVPPQYLEEVNLLDRALKQELTYKALALEFLFDIWKDSSTLDIGNSSLIFECKDGYSPAMPLEEMYGKGGYITLGIKNADGGYTWPDSIEEKFAPLYLVWKELENGVRGFPWPYGLTKMKLRNTQNTFAAALPQADSDFEKGYKSFKLYCMKCHQINKVGGEMGPDLNYPKSITEYMKKEDIWGFIKDPQSYRYNSKMPPMVPLSREEYEEIYKYLVHMKGRVKSS
ncbi:MAG: cytochrome c [Bacteroidota bacterium]